MENRLPNRCALQENALLSASRRRILSATMAGTTSLKMVSLSACAASSKVADTISAAADAMSSTEMMLMRMRNTP